MRAWVVLISGEDGLQRCAGLRCRAASDRLTASKAWDQRPETRGAAPLQYQNLLIDSRLRNVPQPVTDLTRYKRDPAYRKFQN